MAVPPSYTTKLAARSSVVKFSDATRVQLLPPLVLPPPPPVLVVPAAPTVIDSARVALFATVV